MHRNGQNERTPSPHPRAMTPLHKFSLPRKTAFPAPPPVL